LNELNDDIFYFLLLIKSGIVLGVMAFNDLFNNISAIYWRRKLGVPEENHPAAAIHYQTLWHKCCIEYILP